MSDPLSVLISYSWDDAVAAELLHEELALRGVTVVHDRCTFPTGARIPSAMSTAVQRCDGYVVYFTPSSLYEGKSGPRPAIDEEFLPVMDRLLTDSPPVIVALCHGLGDPRGEAVERVRAATGRDIGSLWLPLTLDQGTDHISQPEAAAVSDMLVSEVVRRNARRLDLLEVSVVTRGSGQVPAVLTVDATSTLGGDTPRPGSPSDWKRFAVGLKGLEACLAQATTQRALRLVPRCHLTAALALGRTFHQAAGWVLTVPGRFGDTSYAIAEAPEGFEIAVDRGARGGDVSVEVDVLGVDVSGIAAGVLAAVPTPVATRVTLRRASGGDLTPGRIAAAAASLTDAVRATVHERRPGVVHLFCASPVEFAVLVGHRLTSLHTPIQLYERDGDRYVPSLRLDG